MTLDEALATGEAITTGPPNTESCRAIGIGSEPSVSSVDVVVSPQFGIAGIFIQGGSRTTESRG
jgi:hypothetical protein